MAACTYKEGGPRCDLPSQRHVLGQPRCDPHVLPAMARARLVDLEEPLLKCARCDDRHRSVNTLGACVRAYASGSLPRKEVA